MSQPNRVYLGFVAVLLASFGYAEAQPSDTGRVVEVRVQGNQRMSRDAVLSHVKIRPGQPYDEKLVGEDQQRLARTGRFVSVEAGKTQTPEGVVVTFEVVERPVVAQLQLLGNKALKTSDLMASLPFGANDPLSDFTVEAGRQSLVNKYRGEGYYHARVTVEQTPLADQQVIYRIVEGPKVSIRRVRMEGNEFFGGFRLRMAIGSSARFWPLISGQLNSEQVEQDVNTIRGMYVDEGFLDVEVAKSLTWTADKKRVDLTFVIQEGPRYRVNEIIFRGNMVLTDRELAGRLRLRRGEFYTSEYLRQDLKALEKTYGQLGYIEADVASKRQYLDPTAPLPGWALAVKGPRTALMNVVFEIQEADQYRVGTIEIRGNTVTQSRVIRRELRFYPEQLFNTVAVEESRSRLLDTRLFDPPDGDVSITHVAAAPGIRNAVVSVREGKTALFMIGAGINTNEGLVGQVSFTQKNFDIFRWPRSWSALSDPTTWKGGGQTLRLVAEPGVRLMRYQIEWFEPAMFDLPYSLGTKAFVFTRQREDYDEMRYGGVVSVGHRFKNRWYGEVASRIENVNISDIDTTAPAEIQATRGDNTLLGLKGTLVRDRTDSRWRPSTGDRFRISYEQVMGGWHFGTLSADYRIYRTLYVDALDRKHVLSGRMAAGHIFGTAPVFERFYGGGIGSVRGFDYRGISPRGAGTDDAVGGDFMLFVGAEYVFPLIGNELQGVAFVDTGTVEENFEITTYRAAAGVGLRWIIPQMGNMPMNLDLAFPISKSGDDDTEILSFSLGLAF